MTKIREMIIDSDENKKIQEKAKLLFTFALYLLTAGTLVEYVSVSTLLKILGFMLTGHAFYFLWKSHKLSHF